MSYVELKVDIVHDIKIRYRSLFNRYRSFEFSISVTLKIDLRLCSIPKFVTFDIEQLRYQTASISNSFDIEGAKPRYRRCIQYRVFYIKGDLRYRSRYRGHGDKDPDEVPVMTTSDLELLACPGPLAVYTWSQPSRATVATGILMHNMHNIQTAHQYAKYGK